MHKHVEHGHNDLGLFFPWGLENARSRRKRGTGQAANSFSYAARGSRQYRDIPRRQAFPHDAISPGEFAQPHPGGELAAGTQEIEPALSRGAPGFEPLPDNSWIVGKPEAIQKRASRRSIGPSLRRGLLASVVESLSRALLPSCPSPARNPLTLQKFIGSLLRINVLDFPSNSAAMSAAYSHFLVGVPLRSACRHASRL